MSRLLLSATFVMASLIGVNVSAQETISKAEMRTAPPEQTHERLRDIIWEMFEERDYRRDDLGEYPLDTILLETKVHPTTTQNLCHYNRLVVSFGVADGADPIGSETPVEARDILTSSWWSFVTPPPVEGPLFARTGQQGDLCSNLPEDQHFFRADNRGEAVEGYRAWLTLRQAIKEEQVFDLECNLYPGDKSDCAAVISDLPVEKLRSVERCNMAGSNWCYRLDFGVRRIHVQLAANSLTSDFSVISAELESFIVLSHPRPD